MENDLILASLTRDLTKHDNLKVLNSTKIKDFSANDQIVDLKLNDDSSISTKLLIGKIF